VVIDAGRIPRFAFTLQPASFNSIMNTLQTMQQLSKP
jgi:hypothetical protein